MSWFASGLLIVWPILVLFIFERQPLRRAIVTSFVAAWLFLPPLMFQLPGVPDWSKTTATALGVLFAVLLKQPGRLLAFRPRWFDLPVLGFCGVSLASALSMGVGAYEGLSSVLEEILLWGLPYLMGRVYLADSAGARQLVTGITVGGLLYIPLCLVEIRLSPILKSWVYGFDRLGAGHFGLRYGGYRPMVFMSNGLEVGWWMCCAALCAYLLVASRTTRHWLGLPAVPLAWTLALVAVACKSTGALAQLLIGFIVVQLCRASKRALPLWLLLLVAPAYCLSRPSGYCSGQQISSVLARIFPADRIQSVDYRFKMEDYLIGSAMQHPILGWTRNGGFNPVDEQGRQAAVTDGYWIIVFCCTGSVGLILLNTMLLLPTALFLRRYPVRTWLTPEVAPLLALATILPLFMMDNLSNAMLNPIYSIAMGVLSGSIPPRRGRSDGIEDSASAADPEDSALVEAIEQQGRLARSRPHGPNIERLAALRAQHARALTAQGRTDLALIERTAAEDLWRSVAPASSSAAPRAGNTERAANANDLAWLLASQTPAPAEDLGAARRLAEAALEAEPAQAPYWNTLGIVCYRQGDYHRAIYALSRSVTLGSQGGTAFDFYVLALANRALGYHQMAATWLDRAESWLAAHPDLAPDLAALRAEVDAGAP